MWIVALAWIYVVVLMAATETSVVAGIMTFFGYCVLPLSIVFYITGSKRRRARKAASASASAAAAGSPAAAHGNAGHNIHGDGGGGGVDGGRG
jgi:cytochrome c biogenesis protein CcdA